MKIKDYSKSPQYQRALQRLHRMSPDQRAVFNTMTLDKSFASNEMRRKIQSMQLAADKEARATSLELGKRSLGLQKREIDFAKKQEPINTALALAEAGAGVYKGYQERKSSQELARILLGNKTTPGTTPSGIEADQNWEFQPEGIPLSLRRRRP